MKDQFENSSAMMTRSRRVALILILIVDVGFVLWGGMGALLPQYLLGPGGGPILPSEYEGFTGGSWQEISTASPKTADFMTLLFRMYCVFNVVFGLMAIAIAVKSF